MKTEHDLQQIEFTTLHLLYDAYLNLPPGSYNDYDELYKAYEHRLGYFIDALRRNRRIS